MKYIILFLFNFDLCRFDRLTVEEGPKNQTVTVTARDVGQTIIYFWIRDDPTVYDFIRVVSVPGISPHHVNNPIVLNKKILHVRLVILGICSPWRVCLLFFSS